VLCRCVTSALLRSHGVREDARVHLVLGDAFTVRFDGASVRRLNPDERSTAARVRTALEHRDEAVGHVPADVSPGVELYRMGLADTLDAAAREADAVLCLHEDGRPVVDVEPPTDPLFVLSDHRNFGDDEADLLTDVADERVSLGPEALHADGAITVAHNWLDTAGYRDY
jgi:tRNA (pseudouridine54-N1)-methyltransferase